MNTPDEFERLLAAQPFRPLPPEWQERILTAATARNVAPKRRRGIVAALSLRHAWAALAAVWLGLALLHFDTPPAPVYAGPLPRPTVAEMERQFARHQAETAALLALLDPTPPPSASAAPRTLSSPHAL